MKVAFFLSNSLSSGDMATISNVMLRLQPTFASCFQRLSTNTLLVGGLKACAFPHRLCNKRRPVGSLRIDLGEFSTQSVKTTLCLAWWLNCWFTTRSCIRAFFSDYSVERGLGWLTVHNATGRSDQG